MKELYRSKKYASLNVKDEYLYKKVLRCLPPKPKDRILEIGCGRGFFTKKLQGASKEAIGIDINREAIAQGISSDLMVMDATKLEFSPNSFDKIYSCHVIEHIPNLKKTFQEIERVLRPGGRAVLVYPWELFRGAGAIWTALAMFRNPFLCQKIHLHNLSPKKIKRIVRGSQLEHVASRFSFLKAPQYFTVLQKKDGL